jgi:hypothetical protein
LYSSNHFLVQCGSHFLWFLVPVVSAQVVQQEYLYHFPLIKWEMIKILTIHNNKINWKMIKTLKIHNNDTILSTLGWSLHIESHSNVSCCYAIIVHKKYNDHSPIIAIKVPPHRSASNLKKKTSSPSPKSQSLFDIWL